MGHAHGRFGWADVAVPDTGAGAAFYTGLFGWEVRPPSGDDPMQYTLFLNEGQPVAGMSRLTGDERAAGQPPAWSSYVIVDDVRTLAEQFAAHGGTVLVEPFDIPEAGSMFFGLDPVGAAIGFWEAGEHGGAGAFDVPGAMTWNELACRDVAAALAFYEAILPWTADSQDYDGFTYTSIVLDGESNGGYYDMTGVLPADTPPHWFVWYSVADADATAARATELGGAVERAPNDTPFGRMAVIRDPQGPVFGVIALRQ